MLDIPSDSLGCLETGAGDGGGNPYGIAAIVGVLLVPLVYYRVFTTSPVPAIMTGVRVVSFICTTVLRLRHSRFLLRSEADNMSIGHFRPSGRIFLD